jgi:hypothetical protein
LKARSIRREQKSRTSRAETDEADAGPNINCPGQAITAGRNEYDALISILLRFINGGLQSVGVVSLAITVDGKLSAIQIDGF